MAEKELSQATSCSYNSLNTGFLDLLPLPPAEDISTDSLLFEVLWLTDIG